MKRKAATLTALAVTIVSVWASPVQMRAQSVTAPTDPFVTCIQQMYPRFPREGHPTSDEIQTCVNNPGPQAKRDNVPAGAIAITRPNEFNVTTQVAPRGLVDTVQLFGSVLGIGAQPNCRETNFEPSTLHEEFTWAHEVVALAGALCNDADATLRHTGINERGAGGYTTHEFTNGHDKKGNSLDNGRKLLLTLVTTISPTAAMVVGGAELAKQKVEAIADAVHTVCSAGIERIYNPQTGCSKGVKWYDSKKLKVSSELAALGGAIDVFLGNANERVGTIQIGYSQDG